MADEIPFLSVEEIDDAKVLSRSKGIVARYVKKDYTAQQIKNKFEQYQLSDNSDVTSSEPPIYGFAEVNEEGNTIYGEFIHIDKLKPQRVLGEQFREQRARLPPPNKTQIVFTESEDVNRLYICTGNKKDAGKIQRRLDAEVFDNGAIMELSPTKEVFRGIVRENRGNIDMIEVDPEEDGWVQDEDGTKKVELSDNKLKGDEGILELNSPLIEASGLDSDKIPPVKGLKMKTWMYDENEVTVEMTDEGQFKAYFSANDFGRDSFSEKELYEILIQEYEDMVVQNLIYTE